MTLFARIVSYIFYRFKLPRIVGDLIAGCILGPTILQNFSGVVFPSVNRDSIKALGYLGLIFSSISNGGNMDMRTLKGDFLKIIGFAAFNFWSAFGLSYALIKSLPDTSEYHIQGETYSEQAYGMYFAIIIATSSLPMTFLIIDDLKLNHATISKFCIASTTLVTIFTYLCLCVCVCVCTTYQPSVRMSPLL